MKLLIATKNEKKYRELKTLVEENLNPDERSRFEIVSLAHFPNVEEVVEDGDTFEENAVKKAVGYAKQTGMLTLAEDSGLAVEALNGEPGVYSARFAGEGKKDLENCEKVLRLMEGVPFEKRTAKFICVAALADNGSLIAAKNGEVSGLISTEVKGSGGFGYDPLFFFPPYKKTLAEVSQEMKDKVSHRSKAILELKVALIHCSDREKM